MKPEIVVSVIAVVLSTTARAEISLDTISPNLPQSISIGASLRARWEMWNWFETPQGRNNDYDFVGTVLRTSARWKGDWADVFVEGQSSGLIYDWSAFVNTNIYYAHVFGGEVVQKIFASDEGDFGYIEIMLKI